MFNVEFIRNIFDYFISNQYLFVVLVFIVFLFLAKTLLFFLLKIGDRVAKHTDSDVDDHILEIFRHYSGILVFFLSVEVSLNAAIFASDFVTIITQVNRSILVVICCLLLGKNLLKYLIIVWAKEYGKGNKKVNDELLSLLDKTAIILIYIIGIILFLKIWKVDIAPLLASLGVMGIILGFAVKDSLSNIFGGVSIMLDKSYRIGHVIKLSSGVSGTVVDIGLRSTKIRTWDNEMVVVPNASMANSEIKNYNMPNRKARKTIQIGVVYGTDPEKVKKILLKCMNSISDVAESPEPSVMFTEYGDFALKFDARYWVEDMSKKWPVHQELMFKINKEFNKSNIEMAFPTQTVYVKK